MTWEWIFLLVLIGGFWSVSTVLGDIQHQVTRCAESLVNIDVTLDGIESTLGIVQGEATAMRVAVAPRRPREAD